MGWRSPYRLGPVDLFLPVRDDALCTDAYLIDTYRRARPLGVDLVVPAEAIVEALLDRVVLMGRSPWDVRDHTFAVFGARDAGRFEIAVTEPYHAGVLAALRDTLAEFGPVATAPDAPLHEGARFPLLAYERGRVGFFDGPHTRAFVPLAGRRGVRILGSALAHAPHGDLELL